MRIDWRDRQNRSRRRGETVVLSKASTGCHSYPIVRIFVAGPEKGQPFAGPEKQAQPAGRMPVFVGIRRLMRRGH